MYIFASTRGHTVNVNPWRTNNSQIGLDHATLQTNSYQTNQERIPGNYPFRDPHDGFVGFFDEKDGLLR